MTEPTVTCPNCKTEIKLTESLAAPLLEATRKQYEQLIADKDSDVTKREAAIKEQAAALAKAQQSIDEQVAEKLVGERKGIADEEAKKARLLLAHDLETKAQELTELQEVLKRRDEKLVEGAKGPG